MLLDRTSHVALRIVNSSSVAEAAEQARSVGKIAFVLGFFPNENLDLVFFHKFLLGRDYTLVLKQLQYGSQGAEFISL